MIPPRLFISHSLSSIERECKLKRCHFSRSGMKSRILLFLLSFSWHPYLEGPSYPQFASPLSCVMAERRSISVFTPERRVFPLFCSPVLHLISLCFPTVSLRLLANQRKSKEMKGWKRNEKREFKESGFSSPNRFACLMRGNSDPKPAAGFH